MSTLKQSNLKKYRIRLEQIDKLTNLLKYDIALSKEARSRISKELKILKNKTQRYESNKSYDINDKMAKLKKIDKYTIHKVYDKLDMEPPVAVGIGRII